MKRNGLSLRQKTTLAQRLPDDYEEKIVLFHCYIVNLCKQCSYPLQENSWMDAEVMKTWIEKIWHWRRGVAWGEEEACLFVTCLKPT